MNADITKELIGAGATIAAAVITKLISVAVRERESSRYRRERNLPNMLGHWKGEWFWEDGTLYNSDDIYIESWVRNGRFRGKGMLPSRTYAIEGEVYTTRVMTLSYRTVDFPQSAYVGVACLTFNIDGDKLTGYWSGRAENEQLTGGKTNWHRISG